ncbi:MAG: leucyl aminopeptidase family protein [Planctomycetes bacterium]|nr:leucyl aminopeptidase family protein [Planctomycetota bacterium]
MTRLHAVADPESAITAERFDAVVAIVHDFAALDLPPVCALLENALRIDAQAKSAVTLLLDPGLAGRRLIVAPTGPLTRDYDDVRRFAEAAAAGIRRARDAGARRPLLLLQAPPADERHAEAPRVTAIAALGALWEPLEAREALGAAKAEPVTDVGFAVLGGAFTAADAEHVTAIDGGLRLTKDLCGTEPERMAPPRFAEYVKQAFAGLPVKVTVVDSHLKLQKQYPLLFAVARASLLVPRHWPCVIRLEYAPKGKHERTLLFAGKGLTYDTGGADLKVNGHMSGMSRDKGGAAAVAGLIWTAAKLGKKGIRLYAELGVVRNSIGPDAFVTDEIIRSHAGVRVRIGNTDAEGRLVLADLLSHLREVAGKATDPRLFTCATLTGHAGRAMGTYNIALDNGPARALGTAESLGELGDRHGDPFEVSRLRREDFQFVRPRSAADDVLSCNNEPSSATARGHQFPMAFLAIASGLDRHGSDSEQPIPFTHIDIGGSAVEGGDWQHGRPTGRPLVAMLRALCGG